MIRSTRIPAVLSRILTSHDNILQTAIVVTADGELLGATSTTFTNPEGSKESIESLGALIADIAVDYQRLGDEYAGLHSNDDLLKKSHMQCLLLELEQGLVGISGCVGVDCFVICIAAPKAPMGMIKARLSALAEHVQESLSPLAETPYR